MMNVVRPAAARSSALMTMCSAAASRPLVGSSRIKIGALRSTARAIAVNRQYSTRLIAAWGPDGTCRDADFFEMDVSKPLRISVTLGELDDSLKTLDGYRLYVRRFNPKFKKIEEEPDHDLETVLSVELTVRNSLEAEWPLVSERAKALVEPTVF